MFDFDLIDNWKIFSSLKKRIFLMSQINSFINIIWRMLKAPPAYSSDLCVLFRYCSLIKYCSDIAVWTLQTSFKGNKKIRGVKNKIDTCRPLVCPKIFTIGGLFSYFFELFSNLLMPLSRVCFGIPINLGLRINRGCF